MITALLFAVCCWGNTLPGFAQSAEEPRVPFSGILDGVWGKKRGLLIAVLRPEEVANRYSSSDIPRTLTELLGSDGHYTIRRFGDVSVLALATQSVYSKDLRPISLADASGDSDGIFNPSTYFMSLLSRNQWEKIASGTGLTYTDLETDSQRAMWEKIVPKPFAYQRKSATGEVSPRLLTDAERYSLRFRVTLRTRVYAGGIGNEQKTLVYSDKSGGGEPRDSISLLRGSGLADVMRGAGLELPPIKSLPPPGFPYQSEDGSEWRYGQRVVTRIPNRPKPEDLDYERMDRGRISQWEFGKVPQHISLRPPPGRHSLTVGEILRRISEKIGYTIFASKRASQYAVAVGGDLSDKESVAISDLLPALCFAVSGTLRHLTQNNLYVLARDLEPLVLQQYMIDRWYQPSELPTKNGEWIGLNRKIAEKDILSLLSYEVDDRVTMSPQMRIRYIEALRSEPLTTAAYGLPVARTELPAKEQLFLSAQVKRLNETRTAVRESVDNSEQNVVLDTATYWIGSDIRFGIYFGSEPFLSGKISDGYMAGFDDWLFKPPAPASPPISVRGRIFCLRAVNGKEAKQAVHLAVQASAAALWLEATPEVLGVAVRSAEEGAEKIPVLGVVRPWSVQDAPDTLPRDENVRGEKSDQYLTPDGDGVLPWATQKVRAITAVPGVRGVVLRDVVPPGYRGGRVATPGGNSWTGEHGWRDPENKDPLRNPLGYGMPHRLMFLMTHGSDPADILLDTSSDIGEGSDQADSPFRRSPEAEREWLDWKRDRCAQALRIVRQGAGYAPVYLEGETLFRPVRLGRSYPALLSDTATWFLPWKPTFPPPVAELSRGGWDTSIALPGNPTSVLLGVIGPRTKSPAQEVIERTKRDKEPGLTVVDLSHRTLAEIEAEWDTAKGFR